MYLTLEEAKGMICCNLMTRAGLYEDSVRALCQGDKYMAWRYQTVYRNAHGFEKTKTEKGYCGIAGKPDKS